uniref:Mitochondrial ribosomal protein S24 n=1 Tax=Ornithorhynchus anatinus TaxID=9258 RepID=A0A6I8PAJ5_ORNAN
MGRLYEAESGPGKAGKVPGPRGPSAHFPRLAAELLLAGFPLGLADGDAGGLPLRWVAGVLTALQARLRGRCRLLVLSVLGARGVGKSTLLNTMFGLQFATGGGRARGDVLQLVEVAEPFSRDLGWDFLLAIDSEGLAGRGRAAPEGGEEGDVDERDVARATLAVGLSHVVLVSVTDAADVPPAVPRAFLRMERLGHRPSCQLLLHQGPGSPAAAPWDPAEGAGPLGQRSVAAAGLEKRGPGRTPGQAAFLPTRGHTWHIPGLWHGTPPMAPASLAYSEAALEVKRCLIENLRNGPPDPDRSISQLIERVLSASRSIHTTAACSKNRAARVRVGKGNKPVTYEEAHPPHYIAHRKGWLSHHTSNLDGEGGVAERTVEDVFLRKFMLGTFPGCLADQLVLKRRANQLLICALLLQRLPPHKLYFLVGYSEALLSAFYKCPVRLHLQTLPAKVVYKYI